MSVEPKRFSANGESLTLAEWSARVGVHVETIRLRLKRGASMEEALAGQRKRGRKASGFYANGKTQSLGAWADESGVSRSTLYCRILRGASMEEALSADYDSGRAVRFDAKAGLEGIHLGEYATSLVDVGQALGVSKQRADQIQLSGQRRALCNMVAIQAMRWESVTGISLSNDDIASVVAEVFTDKELRLGLLQGRWDWADVFRAAVKMRESEGSKAA